MTAFIRLPVTCKMHALVCKSLFEMRYMTCIICKDKATTGYAPWKLESIGYGLSDKLEKLQFSRAACNINGTSW